MSNNVQKSELREMGQNLFFNMLSAKLPAISKEDFESPEFRNLRHRAADLYMERQKNKSTRPASELVNELTEALTESLIKFSQPKPAARDAEDDTIPAPAELDSKLKELTKHYNPRHSNLVTGVVKVVNQEFFNRARSEDAMDAVESKRRASCTLDNDSINALIYKFATAATHEARGNTLESGVFVSSYLNKQSHGGHSM